MYSEYQSRSVKSNKLFVISAEITPLEKFCRNTATVC